MHFIQNPAEPGKHNTMYILWMISLAIHIILNIIILNRLRQEDVPMLPRSAILPLFLAIITLRWKTTIHPAAEKTTIKLMKAGNIANFLFAASTLLVILLNL